MIFVEKYVLKIIGYVLHLDTTNLFNLPVTTVIRYFDLWIKCTILINYIRKNVNMLEWYSNIIVHRNTYRIFYIKNQYQNQILQKHDKFYFFEKIAKNNVRLVLTQKYVIIKTLPFIRTCMSCHFIVSLHTREIYLYI